MNGFHEWKAHEVARIQGEDAGDAVDAHGGGNAGVMDLDAGNVVSHQKPAPLGVNGGDAREQRNLVFNHACPPISFLRC